MTFMTSYRQCQIIYHEVGQTETRPVKKENWGRGKRKILKERVSRSRSLNLNSLARDRERGKKKKVEGEEKKKRERREKIRL